MAVTVAPSRSLWGHAHSRLGAEGLGVGVVSDPRLRGRMATAPPPAPSPSQHDRGLPGPRRSRGEASFYPFQLGHSAAMCVCRPLPRPATLCHASRCLAPPRFIKGPNNLFAAAARDAPRRVLAACCSHCGRGSPRRRRRREFSSPFLGGGGGARRGVASHKKKTKNKVRRGCTNRNHDRAGEV